MPSSPCCFVIVAVLCGGGCAGSPGSPGSQASPVSPAAPASAASPAAPAVDASTLARAVEAEVLARERAWLDAYEQRNPAVMEDVLADGFLITFPDGGQQDRAAVIASQRRPRAADDRPPRFTTRGTVARARDGVVVLIGQVIEARIDPQGRPREEVSAYTDTWVREGTTWRVLASHLSRASTSKP